MPNYCEMDIFVRGETEDIKKFLAGIKKDDEGKFSILNSYYPMPDDIKNTNSPVRVVETEEEKQAIIAACAGEPDAIQDKPLTRGEQKQLIAKYGCCDWYEWANQYWGSKWGDFDCTLELDDEEEPNRIKISARSAWCPPKPGFSKVAELFPALTISVYFYEHGMEFQGALEYSGGKLVDVWEKPYHGDRGG